MLRPIGIYAEPKLLIGQSELSYLAFLPQEFQRVALRARMIEAGLCVQPVGCGNAGLAWRVEQLVANDPLIVRFDRGMPNGATPALFACMSNGDICAVEPQGNDAYLSLDDITVPDDGVWRTLTIRYAATHYEPGQVTFTGASKTVTGTNTKFTRLAGKTGDGVRVGDKIYVKTGANAGVYWEIDEVVSDIELTLVNPATGTQTADFLVSGTYYLDDIPTNPTAHNNPSWLFELQDAVVMPDPANYLILADVMLDTGSAPKVQVIDRRIANMFRMKPDARALMRAALLVTSMAPAACNSAPPGNPIYHQEMYAETRPCLSDDGDAVRWTTLAPTSTGIGSVLVATYLAYVRVQVYDATNNYWTDWDAIPADQNRPDTSGQIKSAHIALVPPQIGHTHVMVYQKHGVARIYSRVSPDDGATWSIESNVIAYPDIVDAPTPMILTRSGRMWVFFAFNDGATFYGIKAVFSDDYGLSWDTNGGAAYDVITRAYDGAAFIAPEDATETDDGRIAVLCADREDGGSFDVAMCVLLTTSTLDVTWDPGEDVGGAAPFGPDTVRVYNRAGTPAYAGTDEFQRSAIVALPGDSFGIFHYFYEISGDSRTIGTIASSGNSRQDPVLPDRRTMEILQSTELAWFGDGSVAVTVPNAISARQMPGGTVQLVSRRKISANQYESLNIRVCDSPRVLTFQPACWADLNP